MLSGLALHSNIACLADGHVVLSDKGADDGAVGEVVFRHALAVLMCATYRNQLLNVCVRPGLVAIALHMAPSFRKGALGAAGSAPCAISWERSARFLGLPVGAVRHCYIWDVLGGRGDILLDFFWFIYPLILLWDLIVEFNACSEKLQAPSFLFCALSTCCSVVVSAVVCML